MDANTIIVLVFIGMVIFITLKLNRSKHKIQYKTNRLNNTQLLSNHPNNSLSMEENSNNSSLETPEELVDFHLLSSQQLDKQQQQFVQNIAQSFRRPHPLILPLTQRSFEPNELFELIKTDAKITARILKEVNSSRFVLMQPITNINHAILFLGVAQVKSIAMQIAIKSDSECLDEAQAMAYQKLWQASYIASAFAALFAQELHEGNSAELSTRCLLSYLGDLALLGYDASIADIYLNENSVFERVQKLQHKYAINPAIIGQHIAKQWQLPQTIEQGIENSLLMLTNSQELQPLSQDEMRQALLCYIACRLGDLVVFKGLKNISGFSVDYQFNELVEFYYLSTKQQHLLLQPFEKLLKNITVVNKINKLITQLGT